MISGDSTASHMGSVKNIEKARERRTLETMPGSSEAGVPDDLLQHAETVHPRMGYDMSDSIFMQEMQAAERQKESKKALEERSAIEAFRAAAIQQASPLSGKRPSFDLDIEDKSYDKKVGSPASKTKPIAGIKIRKKKKKAAIDGSTSSRERSSAHSIIDQRGKNKKVRTTKGDKPRSSSLRDGLKHTPVMTAKEIRNADVHDGAGLGLVGYSSGEDEDS